MAIRCADVPAQTTRPTISDIATDVLTSLERNSPLLGDQFYPLGFCHLWPVKSRSFYNGTFRLGEEVQFRKPVLITTQREDPVTPLSAAELAFDLLGGRRNARLIEQGGSGHCVISQASLCTAKKVCHSFVRRTRGELCSRLCLTVSDRSELIFWRTRRQRIRARSVRSMKCRSRTRLSGQRVSVRTIEFCSRHGQD